MKREALIARLAEQRRRERDVSARSTERRARLLDQIRNEDQARRRASAGEAARGTKPSKRCGWRLATRNGPPSGEAGQGCGARRRRSQADTAELCRCPRIHSGIVGAPDERAMTGRRDRERSDRARKDRTELARHDAVAAERAAAARAARRLALRAARLEGDRTSRKGADRSSQVREQATADRRARRREEERRAQAVADRSPNDGRSASAPSVPRPHVSSRSRGAAPGAPATRPRQRLEPASSPLDDPIPERHPLGIAAVAPRRRDAARDHRRASRHAARRQRARSWAARSGA